MSKINELRKLTDEIEKEYETIVKNTFVAGIREAIGCIREFAINNADREDISIEVMKELVEFVEERKNEYE